MATPPPSTLLSGQLSSAMARSASSTRLRRGISKSVADRQVGLGKKKRPGDRPGRKNTNEQVDNAHTLPQVAMSDNPGKFWKDGRGLPGIAWNWTGLLP